MVSGMGGGETLIISVEFKKKQSAKARIVHGKNINMALQDVPRIFGSSVLSQISMLMQCMGILASFYTYGKAGIMGTLIPPFRMVLCR